MNNYPNPQRYEHLGMHTGVNLKNLTIFTWVFITSGFSLDKAIDEYQQNKAMNYICPYKTKTGSCSETLRTEGFIALAKKCHQHKIESCQ